MFTMPNSKIKVLGAAVLVLAIISAIGFVLLKEGEVSKPINWAEGTKRFMSPATGSTRVVDEKSNLTIFSYRDEATFQPVDVKKISEDEWQVTFKKRPK